MNNFATLQEEIPGNREMLKHRFYRRLPRNSNERRVGEMSLSLPAVIFRDRGERKHVYRSYRGPGTNRGKSQGK